MTASSLESAGVAVVVALLTLHHCTTLLADVCAALLGVVRSVNQLRSEWRAGGRPEQAELFQPPPVDTPGASRGGVFGSSGVPAPGSRTSPDKAAEELPCAPPSQD